MARITSFRVNALLSGTEGWSEGVSSSASICSANLAAELSGAAREQRRKRMKRPNFLLRRGAKHPRAPLSRAASCRESFSCRAGIALPLRALFVPRREPSRRTVLVGVNRRRGALVRRRLPSRVGPLAQRGENGQEKQLEASSG